MKKKCIAQSGFFPLRVSFTLLLWAVASWILGTTVLGFFRAEAPRRVSETRLTFAERVAYQRAIENVYWRHRIWPKERPDPKPSPDAVISQAQLEKKVADYLRKSQALEDYWQRPITAEQLQGEMDRMARHTRQPKVLRELFEALGNDLFAIAECLARPLLADRLVTTRNVYDQTPEAELKHRRENTRNEVTVPSDSYVMPVISDGSGCIEDTWAPTNGPPDGRRSPTAVWTGTEMIIWGGAFDTTGTSTGGRYNPATDSWAPTNTTNAPSGREGHTAVWTGSEMIVWGGIDNVTVLNTGGRYNPVTNSWTATSTSNAPSARWRHTAVRTGSEMIVWGGEADSSGNTALDTGGKYNPNTDSWTATSTTNPPAARYLSTAIWTGSEMIVSGASLQHLAH